MATLDPRRWSTASIRNGIVVLVLLGLAIWVAWLDSRVRGAFSEGDLPGPSRVYSRPLELYAGKQLTLSAFREALDRRGYVPVERVGQSGQFAVSDGRVTVALRAFRFLDGTRSARRLRVTFRGSRVVGLRDAEGGQPVPVVRLAPLPIGTFYGPRYGDRAPLSLADVPPLLQRTVLLVEDRDFFDHVGLDPKGILRALWENLKAGGVVQGGSTLTQQLVKSRFLHNQRTWLRKLQEAVMALLVEWHYEKSTILRAYLNEVYLGQRGKRPIRGVGRAARFYFGTSPEELRPDQVALLVGMISAPSYYNPRRHPERARRRRDVVLSLMEEGGLIEPALLERLRDTPLRLAPKEESADAPYPDFLRLVQQRLRRDFEDEELRTRGLRIFTTLSPRIQRTVESTVPGVVADLESRGGLPEDSLQAAVVVTATQTGEILALLGGRTPGYPGFNRAVEASRPIGSLVKPAVYLTALSRPDSYTLVTKLRDESFTVEQPGDTRPWSPRNFSGEYHGEVPLVMALARSYNAATARLGMRLGVPAVLRTLRRLGIEPEVPPLPSVLLGAVSQSPLRVSRMYQTLASGGYRAPVRVVRGVRTAEGRQLQRGSLGLERVVPPGPSYLVREGLRRVTREGTARGLRRRLPEELEFAGKTGTTQNFRDSWFVGFTRSRLMTVWMGRDGFEPAGLTGARGAGRLWAAMARKLPLRSLRMRPPDGVREVWIDRETWLPSDHRCPRETKLPFLEGSVPAREAPCAGGFLDLLSRGRPRS